MKNSNAVENYFQDVIKKSWTWNRLTEAEQKRFINMNVFDKIKGNDKTSMARPKKQVKLKEPIKIRLKPLADGNVVP